MEGLAVEVGMPITKEQRELFHRLITIDDLVDLSANSSISYSTFRSLFYRKGNVTESNKEAVAMMISKSLEKVQTSIIYFEKAGKTLTQMHNNICK